MKRADGRIAESEKYPVMDNLKSDDIYSDINVSPKKPLLVPEIAPMSKANPKGNLKGPTKGKVENFGIAAPRNGLKGLL